MKLLIVSNAPIIKSENNWLAYSPYVKEIEIWSKYATEVAFCCPEWKTEKGLLVSKLSFEIDKTFLLFDFNIKSLLAIFLAFFQIPYNFLKIIQAMLWADHIHLRCPGNVGLLACFIQIFFLSKTKTAKYAGNWDPKAKSPLSYKVQKYILGNTFLSKNIKVLVYGQWKNQSKNIKSFFTATYLEHDKIEVLKRNLKGKIKIIFVGTLSSGKRPLYAIHIIEKLLKKNLDVSFSLYGEGIEREKLKHYIEANSLQNNVFIKGNQTAETLISTYKESHFMLLPSESEGWPKAVAEAMFWGCIPISTSVSCVPYMLDFGNRGLLLENDLEKDSKKISKLILNEKQFQEMHEKGVEWSRKYTLNYFEQEIKLLLQS